MADAAGNGGRPQPRQRLLQLRLIVGELQYDLAGRGVDRCAIGRLHGGCDHARCGIARAREVFECRVHVVEQVGYEVVGEHRRRRGLARIRRFGLWLRFQTRRLLFQHHRSARLLDGEPGDHLRLAIVQEPEVFLGQVAHGVAVAVAHDHGHGHQVYARREFRGRLFGLHFGGGLALGGGLLRHGERARQEEERKQTVELHGCLPFYSPASQRFATLR